MILARNNMDPPFLGDDGIEACRLAQGGWTPTGDEALRVGAAEAAKLRERRNPRYFCGSGGRQLA